MGLFKIKEKGNIFPNYEKLADNLYINHDEKKLIINNNKFNFTDILEAKLIENGFESIVGTGIGNNNLIVGQNRVRINQLDVEIKTNSIENPFFSIPFLKLGIHLGFFKTSKQYKQAYIKAQNCVSILQLIIEDNKKEK